AKLVQHLTGGRAFNRRGQLLQNVKQIALPAHGSPLSDEPVYGRSASGGRRELCDPLAAIGDQKRLPMSSPLGVAAEVLTHLADTYKLHVRHCSADAPSTSASYRSRLVPPPHPRSSSGHVSAPAPRHGRGWRLRPRSSPAVPTGDRRRRAAVCGGRRSW